MTYLYAQDIANRNSNVGVNLNAMDAILSASWAVQLTLLILIIFSVLSWSVILMKYKQFKKVRHSNMLFLKLFWNTPSWDKIGCHFIGYGRKQQHSPAENIFAGFNELKYLAKLSGNESFEKKQAFDIADIDHLKRALRKSSDIEMTKLEFGLSLLATIGSTSPFIGLFGTVWGIMNAFQKIGVTGAAHLAVVAPGISEALIATAFGLFVAIPAVIAYNQYLSRMKKIEVDLDHFQSDFLSIAKRNFFKRASYEYSSQ